MCLILVAWRVHPRYRLVLAANRDEFHARPALPADWWTDRPQLLAGRDLSAGGTWLGVTREGGVAALTNYRSGSAAQPARSSRGGIVVELLTGQSSPIEERLRRLDAKSGDFGAFNVLCANESEIGIYESVAASRRLLAPGVYGLSNHLLDTPWPKVRQAKSQLSEALADHPDDASLLKLLRDETAVPDDALPRTGISVEWERLLSSAFIRSADYGTRCSTVIRIGNDNRVGFREWTWRPDGGLAGLRRFDF